MIRTLLLIWLSFAVFMSMQMNYPHLQSYDQSRMDGFYYIILNCKNKIIPEFRLQLPFEWSSSNCQIKIPQAQTLTNKSYEFKIIPNVGFYNNRVTKIQINFSDSKINFKSTQILPQQNSINLIKPISSRLTSVNEVPKTQNIFINNNNLGYSYSSGRNSGLFQQNSPNFQNNFINSPSYSNQYHGGSSSVFNNQKTYATPGISHGRDFFGKSAFNMDFSNIFNGQSTNYDRSSGFGTNNINTANNYQTSNLLNQVTHNTVLNTSNNIRGTVKYSISQVMAIQKIDTIISTGDITAIIKFINKIASSSFQCDQKVVHLQQLIGRIWSAIAIKKYFVAQKQKQIQAAKFKIKQVRQKIKKIQSNIKSNEITKLQEELKAQLRAMMQINQLYEKHTAQVNQYEISLNQHKEKINQLQSKKSQVNSDIKKQENKVSNYTQIIEDLKIQIQNNEQLKEKSKTKIKQKQVQQQETKNSMSKLQGQINSIKKLLNGENMKKQSTQKKKTSMEDQSKQIKKKLQQQNKYNIKIRANIKSLKLQVNNFEKKTDDTQLQSAKQIVSILNSQINQIRIKSSKVYYSCKGVDDVDVKIKQNQVSYCLNLNSMGSYLLNNYGKASTGFRQLIKTTNQLTEYNILEQKWVQKFGTSFEKDFDKNKTGTEGKYWFESDTKCPRATNSLKNGIIKSIKGREISVMDKNNHIIKLKLGTCTRVQAAQFPRAGMRIIWKGQISNGKQQTVTTCTVI